MLKECNCNKRECKFYLGLENNSKPFDESKEFNYCEAFKNGIPDEIAYGDNDHTTPYEGDNGIMYEKMNKEDLSKAFEPENPQEPQDEMCPMCEQEPCICEDVEEKPFPSDHSFRQNPPDKYVKFRRVKDKLGKGIDVIFGITQDGKTEIQTIRVSADKYTYEQAKKIVEDLGFKIGEGEPAKEEKAIEEPAKPIEEPIKTVVEPIVEAKVEPIAAPEVIEPPKPTWNVLRVGSYIPTEKDKEIAKALKSGKIC